VPIPVERRKSAHLLSVGLIVAFVAFCWGRSAAGQIPPDGPAKAKGTTVAAKLSAPFDGAGTHELTRADAEEFFDLLINDQLAREDVAGAVVGVVKDGQVLLAKGYGYADVAKGVRATGDASLFRIGSISKLITWTAAMQLVEQKKLNLDEDVNTYLDFKIAPAFGKPITLRNLMTHSGGFEDSWRDMGVEDPAQALQLEPYVKTHQPKRIYPPGEVSAYSNYGATLTGYLVQRISGKRFEQYVEENIFRPLGMNRTTFAQPVPSDLAPMLSQGYGLASSPAGPFEIMNSFPAGSVSASASDMCKFMLAHLQDGQLNGAQILGADTARLMHSRMFSFDSRMNSWAYGFYEESTNGHRIIGHGGDLQRFHSDLHLILDAKTGFFVSYNSKGNGDLAMDRQRLLQMFMDRYFPAASVVASDAAKNTEVGDAANAEVGGMYLATRRWESSILKLIALFPAPNGQVEVSVEPDKSIRIDSFDDAAGQPLKFLPIEPLLYEDAENHQRAAFRRGWDGKMQMQVSAPDGIFIQVNAGQRKSLSYFVLIIGLGVIVLTLIFWPVGGLVRKHYSHPLELSSTERTLRIVARLVCVLFCIFLFGWAAVFVVGLQDFVLIMTGLGRWIIVLGVVGIFWSLGTLFLWWQALRAWKGTNVRPWMKIHGTLVALACTGLLWFALLWNLMNFNTRY
jgi:CubicO group peptidase (beta-lactamase class C family)